MTKQIELLSPAGDMQCLQFALQYGADAVYLGAKEFGMRSSCDNFTSEQMKEATHLAHSMGKRVYLTLNTLPTNDEIARMSDFLPQAAQTGIDAFIIADLGVLSLVKTLVPQIEVHLSTQAGIANYASATAAYNLGAKRVVLARELSLEDIRFIRQNTPSDLELEVFVHGAMCMAVSGRCLLSSYLTGRDGNRGNCAQTCRWKYSLVEEKRPGEYFEIGEDDKGSYILSADDLCAAPFINQVIEAGADSLKLEGRAKSFYYVSSVTAAYRSAIDAALSTKPSQEFVCPNFALEELERTSHRPYSAGFYFGKPSATQTPTCGSYIRKWQVVGIVVGEKDGKIICEQRGKFAKGTELEALLPKDGTLRFTPDIIWNGDGEVIEATPHTKMTFMLPAQQKALPVNTILRIEL